MTTIMFAYYDIRGRMAERRDFGRSWLQIARERYGRP